MKVKIAIVGSRNFHDYAFMCDTLADLMTAEDFWASHIVSGGAKGADALAEKIAAVLEAEMVIFPADWDTFGKSAGYLRNRQIVAAADVVVAYWDHRSPGTKHSIDLAREMGKRCFVVDTRSLGKKK